MNRSGSQLFVPDFSRPVLPILVRDDKSLHGYLLSPKGLVHQGTVEVEADHFAVTPKHYIAVKGNELNVFTHDFR
jgi:hypothetical protein